MDTHKGGRVGLIVLALGVLGLSGCGGSSEPAQTPGNAPPASPDDPDPGTDDAALLDILSANPTEIKLDGKVIGKTPINGYKVRPGHHEVVFMLSEEPVTMPVDVGAGQLQTVKYDPAPPIHES